MILTCGGVAMKYIHRKEKKEIHSQVEPMWVHGISADCWRRGYETQWFLRIRDCRRGVPQGDMANLLKCLRLRFLYYITSPSEVSSLRWRWLRKC